MAVPAEDEKDKGEARRKCGENHQRFITTRAAKRMKWSVSFSPSIDMESTDWDVRGARWGLAASEKDQPPDDEASYERAACEADHVRQ